MTKLDKGAYQCPIFFDMLCAMSTTPTKEPASVTSGDTITWQIGLADYPAADGWTLKYRLLGSVGKIDIVSSPAGNDHLILVSATTSAGYPAGDYQFQKYVEKGTGSSLQRFTLVGGKITVAPNLSAASAATDTRSSVKRTLDAIDAVLEGRAGRDDLKYLINTGISNRSLEREGREELMKMRGVYGLKYWRELNPGKIAPAVRVNFGGGW